MLTWRRRAKSVGVEPQISYVSRVWCQVDADRSILGESRDALDQGQRQALDLLVRQLLRNVEDQHAEARILLVIFALDAEILAPVLAGTGSAGLDREALGGRNFHAGLGGDCDENGKGNAAERDREDFHWRAASIKVEFSDLDAARQSAARHVKSRHGYEVDAPSSTARPLPFPLDDPNPVRTGQLDRAVRPVLKPFNIGHNANWI